MVDIRYMKKMLLCETNSYLKNPSSRKKGLLASVVSSSVIEGICAADAKDACLVRKAAPQRHVKSMRSHR